MMRKRLCPLMLTSLMILFYLSTAASGEPYRDNLSIPAPRVFRGMLFFAKSEDYDKIERSLQILAPLSMALSQKYGVDHDREIRSALSSRNQEKTLKSIQRLIFSDMKDLFNHADLVIRESPEKAKVKIRTAFLDYLVLSPFVEVKNFPSDGRIRKMFRDIQFTLDRSAPLGAEGPTPLSPEIVSRMSQDILEELSSLFPELSLNALSFLFMELDPEPSPPWLKFNLRGLLSLFSKFNLKKLLSPLQNFERQ